MTANTLTRVIPFVLATELCERLAFYGLTGSLTVFLSSNLGQDKATATEMVGVFTAITYLTPLFGGWVADAHLGRYRTIVAFSVLYVLGMVLCTVASIPAVDSSALFLVGLLGFVSLGAGGIKPNVVVLGADQFVDPPEHASAAVIAAHAAAKTKYFNYFYWMINVGAMIAFTVLPSLALQGLPSLNIPTEFGFTASFAVPTVAMGVAVLVFVAGSGRYVKKAPTGSVLAEFAKCVWHAGRACRTGRRVLASIGLALAGMVVCMCATFAVTLQFALSVGGMSMIAIGVLGVIVCRHSGPGPGWVVEHGTRIGLAARFGKQRVEDAGAVVRCLPTMGFLIGFWVVYSQMATTFILQGCQMDVRIGRGADAFQLSSATLQLFDAIVVLALVPVCTSFLYPAIARLRKNGKGSPSSLEKIGAGLACSALAMLVAGFVEIARKRSGALVVDGVAVQSNCRDAGPLNALSVWWQGPQYALIGLGEVLASIAAMDFFYAEAPESMRSVCQALNLLTVSLGSMLAAGVNMLFSGWITENLNEGHLECIFFVVAGICAVLFLGFVLVSPSYKSKASAQSDSRAAIELVEGGGCGLKMVVGTVTTTVVEEEEEVED